MKSLRISLHVHWLCLCLCVFLHFAIQYFKFLSWPVVEMLSHSVNHFYRFFL